MSVVIELAEWRRRSAPLSHPAGVTFPPEDPDHTSPLIPEVRRAIAEGSHCAGMIRAIPSECRQGERALVLGSGLGVLSTLTAKVRGVENVIVIEPNITLAAYIEQVHQLNGVPWIETLNGMPVEDGRGRAPLFVRHDVRASSLVPEDGPWRQVMLVPGMNLDLILAEEEIGLIVADGTVIASSLLAHARLDSVHRIIFGSTRDTEGSCSADTLTPLLSAQGFSVERFGGALSFDRAPAGQELGKRFGTLE